MRIIIGSGAVMNNDLIQFKLQIFLHTFVIALIFGVGSIPFLGVDIGYFYGLLLGVCVSIVCFNILLFMSKRVLAAGNKFLATVGYLIRLPIYGFAFYMSMRIGMVAGIACVIGFMAVPLSMLYIFGIKAKIR